MIRFLLILLVLVVVVLYCNTQTVSEIGGFLRRARQVQQEKPLVLPLQNRAPTVRERYTQKIPLKIHQTAYSRNMTHKDASKCLINQNVNPEYEYLFYDEADCVDYIKTHFPQYQTQYDVLNPGAYKSDLFRLLVLYREGGVYIDAKSYCITPLRDILRPEDELFLVRDINPDSIYQGFLCSIPGHPMLKQFIERYISNIDKRHYGVNFWDIGGPLMCGRVLNQHYNRPDRAEIDYFTDGGLRVAGRLVNIDLHDYITSVDRKTPYLERAGPDYLKNSAREMLNGKKYSTAWLRGKVYKS